MITTDTSNVYNSAFSGRNWALKQRLLAVVVMSKRTNKCRPNRMHAG